MPYVLADSFWDYPVDDEEFDTDQDAVNYALAALPSDDFIYLVCEIRPDHDGLILHGMVFAGNYWVQNEAW